MIITLTKPAYEFAERHEGEAALKARAEQEIELLIKFIFDKPEEIKHRIFSWNGVDNIQMGAQGPAMIVDLIAEDDGELEIPLDPHGGQEPDAVPIPSAKEKDHG